MPKHARCSASSSARWIACPRSAVLNDEATDRGSPYALEGTEAHSLCEYLLNRALGRPAQDPMSQLTHYSQEMQDCAEGYRDFVMEQVAEAQKLCHDPFIGIEQRLNFSRWVPEGFGTGDCVIVADELLQITDYKHGLGVLVNATENSQLMCYALGALDTFGMLYNIKLIRLTIYQPRRENVDSWEISTEKLLKWADTVLAPAAKLAVAGKGEFQAGDHCKFCKVRATCRARAEYNLGINNKDFQEPAELTNEEIAAILPLLDGMVSWASDVQDYALQQALNGTRYCGYKVVEGRANRKYTDEDAVAQAVQKAGYDPYEKKLLGITAMTKKLGKKQFEELLAGLIIKPHGKPVLVSESDKRPEYNTVTNADFEQTEE